MKVTAIIPARYASTRFPGKPLAKIAGKAMIQHVYERVQTCPSITETIVATDDQRIFSFVQSFGGRVIMTADTHKSGTDRIAEVAHELSDTDIIVNVQGDEPFISTQQLQQLIALFKNKEVQIATLARPIDSLEDIHNPNVVKVIFNANHQAQYFSRSAIPFLRDVAAENWLDKKEHYQHLGLYAYRKEVLLAISQLPPSKLERLESLEQLRWLESGYTVYLAITKEKAIGVDTPEDLKKAEKAIQLFGGEK